MNVINPRKKHFKRSKHLYYYNIVGLIYGINNKIKKHIFVKLCYCSFNLVSEVCLMTMKYWSISKLE